MSAPCAAASAAAGTLAAAIGAPGAKACAAAALAPALPGSAEAPAGFCCAPSERADRWASGPLSTLFAKGEGRIVLASTAAIGFAGVAATAATDSARAAAFGALVVRSVAGCGD